MGGRCPPCASGSGVPVVSDDDAVAADLSVTVLLSQGEAQVPGTLGVGGGVLPGSGGADHVVAGHGVVSTEVIIGGSRGSCQGVGARGLTGTPHEFFTQFPETFPRDHTFPGIRQSS